MPICLESLEEKFREVEEANERQALDQSADEPSMYHIPRAASRRRSKLRKCASVSISAQSQDTSSSSQSSTPSPLRRVAKSTIHTTLSGPSIIPEGGSDGNPEEEQHATEINRSARRPKTTSALLSRRLPRTKMRSQSLFETRNINVVIGVSVERTIVDCPAGPTEQRSTVYAPKPRRPRAFTVDFPLPSQPGGNLVQRAKEFARRIRRKMDS